MLVVINNPTSTAVTIPGFGGAVTTCISYRAKLTPEALRRAKLAAGTARKAPLPKGAGTAGEPPVAFAATEGFTAGTFRKYRPMWKPASLSSPRLGGAEAPPFGKGGFGLRFYFHPVTLPGTGGAVTICRRLPCENGCGHCPPVRSRFHFLTLLLYTILSKKASRKIPT